MQDGTDIETPGRRGWFLSALGTEMTGPGKIVDRLAAAGSEDRVQPVLERHVRQAAIEILRAHEPQPEQGMHQLTTNGSCPFDVVSPLPACLVRPTNYGFVPLVLRPHTIVKLSRPTSVGWRFLLCTDHPSGMSDEDRRRIIEQANQMLRQSTTLRKMANQLLKESDALRKESKDLQVTAKRIDVKREATRRRAASIRAKK
jgi:hypothetical protein